MSFNISVHNDALNTGVFTPSTVISNSHVKINGKSISIETDDVTTHSRTLPNQTHAGAFMVSSNQSFVRINSFNIIVDGDSASCDVTHTVNATGFVLITT
jgi:uncharacterized Zn-binding protein involved in type VI secretion